VRRKKEEAKKNKERKETEEERERREDLIGSHWLVSAQQAKSER